VSALVELRADGADSEIAKWRQTAEKKHQERSSAIYFAQFRLGATEGIAALVRPHSKTSRHRGCFFCTRSFAGKPHRQG
jgi:hypothetical protein